MVYKTGLQASAMLVLVLLFFGGVVWYGIRQDAQSIPEPHVATPVGPHALQANASARAEPVMASPFSPPAKDYVLAGVTGRWQGAIDMGGSNRVQVSFNLRATDGQLSGTATFPVGEGSIEDGKITGKQLSFSARHRLQSTGQILVTRFAGEMSEGTIALRMQTEGGESRLTINQVSR